MVEVSDFTKVHWITAMQPVDHDATEGNPNMFIRWGLRDVPQPSIFEGTPTAIVPD